jgi:hypothetical protein
VRLLRGNERHILIDLLDGTFLERNRRRAGRDRHARPDGRWSMVPGRTLAAMADSATREARIATELQLPVIPPARASPRIAVSSTRGVCATITAPKSSCLQLPPCYPRRGQKRASWLRALNSWSGRWDSKPRPQPWQGKSHALCGIARHCHSLRKWPRKALFADGRVVLLTPVPAMVDRHRPCLAAAIATVKAGCVQHL